MRAGWAGSTITATRARPVGDERRAVEHHPAARAREHPRERDLAGRVRALRRAQRAAGDRQHRRRAACRASQSPSGSSASQRSTPGVSDSTLQSSVSTTSPGASGPSGSAASPTSRPRRAPSARCGATARRKLDLVVVEQRLAGLAVEAEHAPGFARPRAQGDAAAPGRRPSPCWPASAGCGWDRRRSPRAASRCPRAERATLGQLVDVVLVVLVREPLRRELGHARSEVAGDQQRRGVEREPAGRHVVRHQRVPRPRSTPPEGDEVEALRRPARRSGPGRAAWRTRSWAHRTPDVRRLCKYQLSGMAHGTRVGR